MKVVVAIKRVLDHNLKVRIKSDQSNIDLNNLKMSINPFDEIAVEEGVRLIENGIASELIVVSIGPLETQDILRSALALGADRGILIQTMESFEPLNIAKILKNIINREQPGLVILGKQAIDDDCSQTGQMLAALLDWPQGTFISQLDFHDDKMIVIRETDEGNEKLELPMPAVLTTDLRLNTPRYLKLSNIIKAKQKPLEIIDLLSLNLKLNSHQTILKFSEPPARQPGRRVQDVPELMSYLHDELRGY